MNKIANCSKYISYNIKALNLGVFGADLSYSVTFEQFQQIGTYVKTTKKLAEDLIITRVRFAKYEEGKSEPPFEILKRISKYFHVSIDILINVDLQKIPIDSLLKMEDNRILLPITIDKSGRDYIEILPYKAKAGYLSGYSDPEFIEKLQQMHLPYKIRACIPC